MFMALKTNLSVATSSSQGLQGSAAITSHADHQEQLSRVMGSTALGSESVNSFKDLLSAGPHQGLAKQMFDTEEGPLRGDEGASASFEGHLAAPAPPADPLPFPKMKKRREEAKKIAGLENGFFKMEAALIKDVQGLKKAHATAFQQFEDMPKQKQYKGLLNPEQIKEWKMGARSWKGALDEADVILAGKSTWTLDSIEYTSKHAKVLRENLERAKDRCEKMAKDLRKVVCGVPVSGRVTRAFFAGGF